MTLGIMGLDKVGLQILATAGDSERERRHAKVLIPVREKGNWLLCTLLIANTIANTFLPILIASFAGGVYGFIGSTILILVLAEIAPQAICSRYGLVLAARMIYVIYFFMALLAPVAWPLSWVLDRILGREVGTIYSRAELKHLITIHVENPEHQEESGREFWCFLERKRERKRERREKEKEGEKREVEREEEQGEEEETHPREGKKTLKKLPSPPQTVTREDYKVISGALDIRDKRVRDVMTRVDKVFMLDASTRLNFDEMLTIYKSGEREFFKLYFVLFLKEETQKIKRSFSPSPFRTAFLAPPPFRNQKNIPHTTDEQATPVSRSGRGTARTSSASSTQRT